MIIRKLLRASHYILFFHYVFYRDTPSSTTENTSESSEPKPKKCKLVQSQSKRETQPLRVSGRKRGPPRYIPGSNNQELIAQLTNFPVFRVVFTLMIIYHLHFIICSVNKQIEVPDSPQERKQMESLLVRKLKRKLNEAKKLQMKLEAMNSNSRQDSLKSKNNILNLPITTDIFEGLISPATKKNLSHKRKNLLTYDETNTVTVNPGNASPWDGVVVSDKTDE